MWGVGADKLDDLVYLNGVMCEAINVCGATIEGYQHKRFDPHGVTILFMLSESHMSLHSYPESNYCSMDIYTCGSADPQKAADYIIDQLQPTRCESANILRGIRSNSLC